MFGTLPFGAAQLVQAQTRPSAEGTVNMSSVAPGGQVEVTVTTADTGAASDGTALTSDIREKLPAGFTVSAGQPVGANARCVASGVMAALPSSIPLRWVRP